MLKLDREDLKKACATNTKIANICRDKRFQREYKKLHRETSYLIYAGCFCPPHKGHYDVIKKYVDSYDNIYIFIWDPEESRHGVPAKMNQKVWKTWAQKLGTNVHIILVDENDNPLLFSQNWVVNHVAENSKITFMVGSDYTEKRIENLQNSFEDIAKMQNKYYPNASYKQLTRSKYSATDFVKCLKNPVKSCENYIPEEMGKEWGKEYINKLRTYKLKEK
uniref:Cytidylyltransferase-like protein n=1 Tax=Marseillevirus LCMAC102 TaxID=2506603 RepID=A0A481YU11_9VIRU|nr:MAG: cytidylyltransferase-like protein [Marseillevirus LCMAC102]